jgi:hypothetical protein
MPIKQFRLETANVSGKLSYLSDVLGKHGVNIRAISVGSETGDVSSRRQRTRLHRKASTFRSWVSWPWRCPTTRAG